MFVKGLFAGKVGLIVTDEELMKEERAYKRAKRRFEEATERRRGAIREHAQGTSQAHIGRVLGLTRARVSQIVDREAA